MYKLLPILLFAFGFTETMEVYYKTDTPIAGFQFNIEGVKVTDAFSGDAETEGFTITTDNNIVLGFSFDGATIQTGNGILLVLDVDGNTDNICLTDVIISDNDGEGLDVTVEDCNTINISGTVDNSIERFDSLVKSEIDSSNDACADDDAALAPFDCASAVSEHGCEMIWNGMTISVVCPVSCDACPKPTDGRINEFYNTSWAVIIGINAYENMRPLSYAVQDAKEIKELLISNFGFPKGNIKLLTDRQATLTNIRDDLYEIASIANEEDRILIYFAGHGETRSLKTGGDKGYLIPADGNIDKIFSTCLPMTEIREIANVTVAKHVLFLLDACFSGLATVNTRGIDRSTPGYIEKIVRDQARQIITAGGKKDEVIEKDEWGHSAFAKNLIQGLKDAVADHDYDGYITADELGSYLKKRVSIDSENLQTPIKARFGSGEGEFVFRAKKIIESTITNIIPYNIYEKDEITSEEANLLHQRLLDVYNFLYGDDVNEYNILRDLARIKKKRDQAIQFILGCMDESAINYNPNANLDDESCVILDSDDVYIRFGNFHNLDSTLDVFMASNRRIYNLEIFTEGFEIVDVLAGNLGLDNIKTSFNLEEIYVEFSDSLDGYIIPKEETLLFKAKIMPIDEAFCFTGLTINGYETTNVLLGECVTGLMVQEVALSDTTEVEILTGEFATETGTILQETEEGKYDILLQDSTIVHDIDPSEVNRINKQIYSGNYLYIKKVDYSLNIIEIFFQSYEEIAGFQFNVDGADITSASGGAAGEAGFMVSSSSTTALGFSLSGSTIPSGEGTLLFLNYGEQSSAICITEIIVSDPNGNAIDFQTGECWVH